MKKLNINERDFVVGGFNCDQALILTSYTIGLLMAVRCAYTGVSVLIDMVKNKKVSVPDLIAIEVGNFDVIISFLGIICLGKMYWSSWKLHQQRAKDEPIYYV